MRIVSFLISICICSVSAMACGISWSISNMTAFEGINALGEVDITERIGYVDVDGENRIDLAANFNSNRKSLQKNLITGVSTQTCGKEVSIISLDVRKHSSTGEIPRCAITSDMDNHYNLCTKAESTKCINGKDGGCVDQQSGEPYNCNCKTYTCSRSFRANKNWNSGQSFRVAYNTKKNLKFARITNNE